MPELDATAWNHCGAQATETVGNCRGSAKPALARSGGGEQTIMIGYNSVTIWFIVSPLTLYLRVSPKCDTRNRARSADVAITRRGSR